VWRAGARRRSDGIGHGHLALITDAAQQRRFADAGRSQRYDPELGVAAVERIYLASRTQPGSPLFTHRQMSTLR
jgi:hypothetical protein